MTTRILYIGSFAAPRCTDNAYKYAFEQLGCTVHTVEQQTATEDRVAALLGGYDLLLYTRTHNRAALTPRWTTFWREHEARGLVTASVHLDVFVGVQRYGMSDQWDDPLFTTGTVFTPDPELGEHITTDATRHVWLPPAADLRDGDPEGEAITELAGKIVFVGSLYGTPNAHPEYPFRNALLTWLRATFNNDFYWYGGGSPLGVKRGKDLWDIYASDCVIVGDSCFAGDRPHYWSDRVPETLAHYGVLVHPDVEGIHHSYPLLRVFEPGDFTYLHEALASARAAVYDDASDALTRGIQAAWVARDHTYVNRARTILDTLGLPYD